MPPPADPTPQPNVIGAGSTSRLPATFWLLVAPTGVGAGLAGGLLMALLRSGAARAAVADAQGRIIGEAARESLLQPSPAALPLETATAADFVTPRSAAGPSAGGMAGARAGG